VDNKNICPLFLYMNIPLEYQSKPLEYARLLLQSGDIIAAIDICEFLIQTSDIEKNGPEIFIVLAQTIDMSGDAIAAKHFIYKAMQLFPGHQELITCYHHIPPIHSSIVVNPYSIKISDSSQTELSMQGIPINSNKEYEHIQKRISQYDSFLPKLEYTSITTQTVRDDKHQPPIETEFPDFPDFSYLSAAIIVELKNQAIQKPLNALEELAKRLEHARIPAIPNDPVQESPTYTPSIVTETMATIYEKQGAYTQAIKAYQILARKNPDKLMYFEEKIEFLRKRINNL
jgi:tetratricopeptide (TPR) repeat protein